LDDRHGVSLASGVGRTGGHLPGYNVCRILRNAVADRGSGILSARQIRKPGCRGAGADSDRSQNSIFAAFMTGPRRAAPIGAIRAHALLHPTSLQVTEADIRRLVSTNAAAMLGLEP